MGLQAMQWIAWIPAYSAMRLPIAACDSKCTRIFPPCFIKDRSVVSAGLPQASSRQPVSSQMAYSFEWAPCVDLGAHPALTWLDCYCRPASHAHIQ